MSNPRPSKESSTRRANAAESSGLNRPRQQYHYLYGSTEESTSADAALRNQELLLRSAHSPTATDQDSLVGESLVQTDTEHEEDFLTPNNSEQDFQQLIITNGNGATMINGGTHTDEGASSRYRCTSFWRWRYLRFRQNHPVLYFSTIGGAVSAIVLLATIVMFPHSRIASIAFPSHSRYEWSYYIKIPFPKVDRADYGDPVSNFLATELLDPAFFSRGPTEVREFIFPFPTGAFWTNLVLPPTADRGLSFPVAVYPYAYKWSDSLLQVSYPARHRVEDDISIHDYFFPDLTLSASETTQRRHIVHFDPLSVTLRWYLNTGGHMETYLVQGSPYVTVKYDNVSPVIQAFSIFKSVVCPRDDDSDSQILDSENRQRHRKLSFGICESTSDEIGNSVTLRGVQFVLQTQEGMNWLVFASEPIEFVFDTQVKTTISASSRFRGVLRFALIPSVKAPDAHPNNSSSSQLSSSTGLQRLIYHAGVYPVSGDVSWSFRPGDNVVGSLKTASRAIAAAMTVATEASAGGSSTSSSSGELERIATISFQFATSSFSPASTGTSPKSLLMLALPHHAQSLPSSSQLSGDQFDLLYRCIKGPMRPILGSTWTYDETLPAIGFEILGTRMHATQLVNPIVLSPLVESLKEDVQLALPTLDENVYGFGKQAARLAQVAHIADEVITTIVATSNTSESEHGHRRLESDFLELTEVLDNAVEALSSALEHFLTNSVADYLVYDSNLGGIVTLNGLRSKDADFGNGRYNDHHFHYGYILYACAIMGKIDSNFVRKFGNAVDSIYFDVANDSNFVSQKAKGIFFPGSRHKSWFDGHSFASGLFPFGNGKSQESSSEAVNCYYGALLWSVVRHNAASEPTSDLSYQTDFARLLLATEIRGAQMYWHMRPPLAESKADSFKTSVYSPQFSRNYMVGNLGMLDAVASTWFGTEKLYVHMINEIPVTAVTAILFTTQYVEQAYNAVLKPLGEVEMAWLGYVVCNLAIVNANTAWRESQRLFSPQLDSALSKSQVLYWVATRPEFNATAAFVGSSSKKSVPSRYVDSSDNEVPTEDAERDPHSGSGRMSSCASHSECTNAGLTGACCPTAAGAFLDCCKS